MPKKNGHTFEFNLTYNDWKFWRNVQVFASKLRAKFSKPTNFSWKNVPVGSTQKIPGILEFPGILKGQNCAEEHWFEHLFRSHQLLGIYPGKKYSGHKYAWKCWREPSNPEPNHQGLHSRKCSHEGHIPSQAASLTGNSRWPLIPCFDTVW